MDDLLKELNAERERRIEAERRADDWQRSAMTLAAEHEAVHLYMAHAQAADDPLAQKVLVDIADEERVHAGEFARLLAILTGDEDALLAQGAQEVDEMALELSAPETADKPKVEEKTIGSLKK